MQKIFNNMVWFMALVLVVFMAGCGLDKDKNADKAISLILLNALGNTTAPGAGTGTGTGKGPAPVVLGTAGNFVILSKSGISNVPTSDITGDIGTSPITGAAIIGLDCIQVSGSIYTVDAAGPACRTVDASD